MKIIFFGASSFVIPIIKILNTRFDLALVVTTEHNPSDAVPLYCNTNDIPFVPVIKFDDELRERFIKINAPVAALAYFGMILPKEILNIFPNGIINIHPSLLPKYRGATPVQSAILNGDRETGVTIIKLDAQMDHGPMLNQIKELIFDNDTTETLHERLFKIGADLLVEILPSYLDGNLRFQVQNDKDATFSRRSFKRQDGYFDINNPPSKLQIDRMIRAYYPWPTAWTLLNISVSGGQVKEKRVIFLPGNKLQVEGKKPMTIKDFINGYPQLKNELNKILPI